MAGLAAGYVTKTKVFGVVAAYPIPEVISMIDTFTLGAQKVNPDITVKVVWLNSWFDPNKSQEAARSLVAQKADVLFSLYQDTPEVVSLAEQLGVYVISTSSDMKSYAPRSISPDRTSIGAASLSPPPRRPSTARSKARAIGAA